ncbi:MAG: YIP1 family protein [Chroococcidiopsidaceae cyanobacterium CP_BM_RX_35]|nr:YIP1 family protein [Chroococcidiopsidaceae cyanobacterium CP_BM_RX_35]
MTTALDGFWDLLRGAMALHPEAFRLIETLPRGTQVAIYVLLLAGLSQAIAQSIVLFVNQVKPIRFMLSLGIAAILFVISTAFWIFSVWAVSHLLYRANPSFMTVFRVLGLAYAPLTWSFLGAMPYFGVPIGVVLSIWSLLAFVRGFNVVTDLGHWQILWCAILGWIVFQIMQRTIGRPAEAFGQWLSDSVAGKQLVTNVQGLEQMIQASFGTVPVSQADGDHSNDPGG